MAPRRQVAPNQTECVECGLGATSITITLGGDAQSHPPADPRAMAQLAANRERAQAVLSDPPFPLFGLDDRWMGPRSLGGTGSSGGETTSVTLAHGHLLEQVGPDIRVETKRDARFPVQALRALEARALVMRLAHHTGEMREDVRTATFAEDATDVLAPWEQVELPVDERRSPSTCCPAVSSGPRSRRSASRSWRSPHGRGRWRSPAWRPCTTWPRTGRPDRP